MEWLIRHRYGCFEEWEKKWRSYAEKNLQRLKIAEKIHHNINELRHNSDTENRIKILNSFVNYDSPPIVERLKSDPVYKKLESMEENRPRDDSLGIFIAIEHYKYWILSRKMKEDLYNLLLNSSEEEIIKGTSTKVLGWGGIRIQNYPTL